MHKVIDSPWQIGQYAAELKAAGVDTVIRYYNHQNSTKLPQKCIEKAEYDAILQGGLSLAVVFEQRAGAPNNDHDTAHIEDLSAQTGKRDAERALALAKQLGQPVGSAIYFAVDFDFTHHDEIASILDYFEVVSEALKGTYRVGAYGSGMICKAVRDAGHADLIWLAAGSGWSGSRDMLKTDQWALYQLPNAMSYKGVGYDGNFVGAKWTDFGQFRAAAAQGGTLEMGASSRLLAAVSKHTELAEIRTTGALNLRGGPGTNFPILKVLAKGAPVVVLERADGWAKVDVNGDGGFDGYVSANYLTVLSGGFPIVSAMGKTPYEVAKAELAQGVAEVPGPGDNPRIVLYHRSTDHTDGTADSVAWCSSFVNYCVEQAGMEGTDSQSARSWENWGQDVTRTPQEGDIAVFARGPLPEGHGHVGFFVEDQGTQIKLLGGNQGDRVCYSSYPKGGMVGTTPYQLLSIRRG
ncbi:TIGR02594 family protein [Rhizobium sp. C1]|uniref:TIGR02594 family protein n=1 Tax=Rhizobium sp. C1 TaxID=1349799 RepID=UPI001E4B613D|nr:TIGR02594 family protein [Rhizobium sp. C1]MCD2179403.1 TIGR02594 family protein [Rhizobium sp. C1]